MPNHDPFPSLWVHYSMFFKLRCKRRVSLAGPHRVPLPFYLKKKSDGRKIRDTNDLVTQKIKAKPLWLIVDIHTVYNWCIILKLLIKTPSLDKWMRQQRIHDLSREAARCDEYSLKGLPNGNCRTKKIK